MDLYGYRVATVVAFGAVAAVARNVDSFEELVDSGHDLGANLCDVDASSIFPVFRRRQFVKPLSQFGVLANHGSDGRLDP